LFEWIERGSLARTSQSSTNDLSALSMHQDHDHCDHVHFVSLTQATYSSGLIYSFTYSIVQSINQSFDIEQLIIIIMGKKNRQTRNTTTTDAPTSMTTPISTAAPPTTTASTSPVTYYPSDGPSDVALLQTTSTSLQTKLNLLTELGLIANDRAGFVQNFVPLDLSAADAQAYLQDLTTAPEAEGQWRNLIAEIAAIRGGKGVDRIEGDQVTNARFFFSHPLLENCDREVSFVCVRGEWRADG
jgi:hypothetical protein